jgi:hypothetical protein
MSIHSNAVLTALNAIQHWEYYPEDEMFLKDVAFPLSRDALAFYQCWMRRYASASSGAASADTHNNTANTKDRLYVWSNERDQSHECIPPTPASEARKTEFCYQNNSVLANGLIRRVASVLPRMARQIGTYVDPQWQEIADYLLPAPTMPLPDGSGEVFVLAGNYTTTTTATKSRSSLHPTAQTNNSALATADNWTAWCENPQMCGTEHCNPCLPQPTGSQNIATWQVWPGEAIGLLSPEPLKRIVHNTLRSSAPWKQSNSFCNVYSQAARSGMALTEWLPQLKTSTLMPNLVAHKIGGGIEVAGLVQVFADLMLQSVTPINRIADEGGENPVHYLALFPLQFATDLHFYQLRGKGGFVVSASWGSAAKSFAGAAEVLSIDGNNCTIVLNWMTPQQTIEVTLQSSGAKVQTTVGGVYGSVSFPTTPGGSYFITVANE